MWLRASATYFHFMNGAVAWANFRLNGLRVIYLMSCVAGKTVKREGNNRRNAEAGKIFLITKYIHMLRTNLPNTRRFILLAIDAQALSSQTRQCWKAQARSLRQWPSSTPFKTRLPSQAQSGAHQPLQAAWSRCFPAPTKLSFIVVGIKMLMGLVRVKTSWLGQIHNEKCDEIALRRTLCSLREYDSCNLHPFFFVFAKFKLR